MRIKHVLTLLGVVAGLVVTPATTAQADIWCYDNLVASFGPVPEVTVRTASYGDTGVCVTIRDGLIGSDHTGYAIGFRNVDVVPVVDDDVAGCPTQDDLLAGQVADPSNPLAYTPYRVAAGVHDGVAMLCIVTRDFRVRLQFQGQDGEPEIEHNVPYYHWTPAYSGGTASGTCGGTLGTGYLGSTGYFVGTNFTWGTSNDFCVRVGNTGGRLSVGAGNVLPSFGNPSCPTTWWTTTAPVASYVRTGPTDAQGRTPVCINVAGFGLHYLVDPGYRPGVPVVQWTPDA